ncbi:MAG TPA: nitrate reductase, partial [Rhodoferax sp.]
MSMLSIFYAVLFNVAAVVLVAGIGNKIRRYAGSPAPLKIPTTPAPITQSGVYWRLVREVVYFESLFKSSKWTWIFGWAFHFTL